VAEGFAAIPTWMIRDVENVSGHAIAVYGVLATYSGLRVNAPGQPLIAREARISERKVRDALAELERLGVVERLKRGAEGGRGRATDAYRLMDRPLRKDETSFPAGGAGKPDLPAREDAFTGTDADSVLLIEVDSSEVDRCASAHPQSAHSFEEWWSIYPLKKDKGRARTAWKSALKKASAGTLVAAAAAYRDDPNRAPQFTKYPASWLNAEAWENGPLPTRRNAGNGTAVENMLDRMRNRTQDGGGSNAIGA
jgi:hypothetical protein